MSTDIRRSVFGKGVDRIRYFTYKREQSKTVRHVLRRECASMPVQLGNNV